MKKQFILWTLLATLLLTSCAAGTTPPAADAAPEQSAPESSQPVWQTITAEDAKARMDSGDAVTIVDVRSAEEYEQAHIPGALLIPVEEIGDTQPDLLPDLDAEILVYCRSGRRSAEASKKLAAIGYPNIKDFGGINDWPYETEAGAFTAPKTGLLAEFTSEDLDGNSVDSSVFAGYKVNMLNIWATYCGPCINEMPELGELAATYREKGAQIIGVVMDVRKPDGTYSENGLETARQVVKETGADYLHLLPSPDLYEKKLSDIYAVPTTIFVDENGAQIGEPFVGAQPKEAWAATLDQLLEDVG